MTPDELRQSFERWAAEDREWIARERRHRRRRSLLALVGVLAMWAAIVAALAMMAWK